jgi:hypothetical protein
MGLSSCTTRAWVIFSAALVVRPPAPGASAAFPGRQPRRHRVGFAHQAIECRLAGLGHWFVGHSQSGEWTAGFGGVLFGLKCRKQRLGGVFPHCAPQSFASPTSAHSYQRGADVYLAKLLGADRETALRWFVLVVALLLDPAAVLLLLAATSARRLTYVGSARQPVL